MARNNQYYMLKKIIKSLFGDFNEKELKKINPFIPEINQKEEEYQKLSDDELKESYIIVSDEETPPILNDTLDITT